MKVAHFETLPADLIKELVMIRLQRPPSNLHAALALGTTVPLVTCHFSCS